MQQLFTEDLGALYGMGSVKKVFKDLRFSDLKVYQTYLRVLINHRLLGPNSGVSTKIYTGSGMSGAKVIMMAKLPAVKVFFLMQSDLITYCKPFSSQFFPGDPQFS